jgi:hypothetical protein
VVFIEKLVPEFRVEVHDSGRGVIGYKTQLAFTLAQSGYGLLKLLHVFVYFSEAFLRRHRSTLYGFDWHAIPTRTSGRQFPRLQHPIDARPADERVDDCVSIWLMHFDLAGQIGQVGRQAKPRPF